MEVQKKYDTSLKGRYRAGKARAKRKGQSWKISFDEYQLLMLCDQCHYCEGSLNPYGTGLDRKDSSEGYELYNLVPCCASCNSIKGEYLSYWEAKLVISALRLVRGGR